MRREKGGKKGGFFPWHIGGNGSGKGAQKCIQKRRGSCGYRKNGGLRSRLITTGGETQGVLLASVQESCLLWGLFLDHPARGGWSGTKRTRGARAGKRVLYRGGKGPCAGLLVGAGIKRKTRFNRGGGQKANFNCPRGGPTRGAWIGKNLLRGEKGQFVGAAGAANEE